MKAAKVRLYIRIKLADGRYAYADPAWNRNHTIRAAYAQVKGKQEHHPEGVYYLRYAKSGKRVWRPVGVNPDAAVVALRNVEHDLRSVALGRDPDPIASASSEAPEAGVPVADTSSATPTVLDAVTAYLNEMRPFRLPQTVAHAEAILRSFCERLPGCRITDVDAKQFLSTWFG